MRPDKDVRPPALSATTADLSFCTFAPILAGIPIEPRASRLGAAAAQLEHCEVSPSEFVGWINGKCSPEASAGGVNSFLECIQHREAVDRHGTQGWRHAIGVDRGVETVRFGVVPFVKQDLGVIVSVIRVR